MGKGAFAEGLTEAQERKPHPANTHTSYKLIHVQAHTRTRTHHGNESQEEEGLMGFQLNRSYCCTTEPCESLLRGINEEEDIGRDREGAEGAWAKGRYR